MYVIRFSQNQNPIHEGLADSMDATYHDGRISNQDDPISLGFILVFNKIMK
jgi:hypothetical protein